jgi:DNA-binding transcriptional MerR regulator
MRVGELAVRTGVSVRALRYYEEQHLLTPERSSSGQRHYRESAVERVQLIQRLYTAGLTSKTIADLIPCVTDGRATPGLLTRLTAELGQIDERLTDLQHARDQLAAVITAATRNLNTGTQCRETTP